MIILENTGMIEGEFGKVDAYNNKKQEIIVWLQDPNKKVSTFAEKYLSTLDKQIISEKRRAEENIELRKHQFGPVPR